MGLDSPGSNPGGDEIFRPSRPALGPTQPPVQWVTVHALCCFILYSAENRMLQLNI